MITAVSLRHIANSRNEPLTHICAPKHRVAEQTAHAVSASQRADLGGKGADIKAGD